MGTSLCHSDSSGLAKQHLGFTEKQHLRERAFRKGWQTQQILSGIGTCLCHQHSSASSKQHLSFGEKPHRREGEHFGWDDNKGSKFFLQEYAYAYDIIKDSSSKQRLGRTEVTPKTAFGRGSQQKEQTISSAYTHTHAIIKIHLLHLRALQRGWQQMQQFHSSGVHRNLLCH